MKDIDVKMIKETLSYLESVYEQQTISAGENSTVSKYLLGKIEALEWVLKLIEDD